MEPKSITEVSVRGSGTPLSPFRPITRINILNEVNDEYFQRVGLFVIPSISTLSSDSDSAKVTIFNPTNVTKSLNKSTHIAFGTTDFEEVNLDDDDYFPKL